MSEVQRTFDYISKEKVNQTLIFKLIVQNVMGLITADPEECEINEEQQKVTFTEEKAEKVWEEMKRFAELKEKHGTPKNPNES